jgi:predicted lipoprotein with Yx(FWY)xxD motif
MDVDTTNSVLATLQGGQPTAIPSYAGCSQHDRGGETVIIRTMPGATRRAGAAFLAIAAVALVSAGCSNDNGSSTSGAVPVPSANGQLVSAQPTSLGTVLVDGRGHTVYLFANDKTTQSTCTGGCAGNWPFVPAPATQPTTAPGVTGALGVTTRSDGARQLTVSGHPVYTFAGDSAPGQTNGQNMTLDGGLWTAVSPAGSADTSAAQSGSPAQNPGGPGY